MGRLFSTSGVIQDAVSATGNGSVFDVSGLSTLGVAISGTFVGTLTFQGRLAGGTWTAIQAENLNSGALSTTATAVGLFGIPVAPIDEFRVPVTWTSGTSVTVTVSGTVAASGTTLADIDVQMFGGVAPQMDDTDKIAVSTYFAGAAVGDTAFTRSLDADGQTINNAQPMVASKNQVYSGTTWDRLRNNVYAQLAASAARTATLTTADQTNYNHKGIILIVDVTARAAATTLSIGLQVKQVTGTSYVTIWTIAAAINSADTTLAYLFYPTAGDAAALYTEEVDCVVPRTFRVVVTPNNADSVTYSLDLYYLL